MLDRYHQKYRIPSTRLQKFDYSSNGYYFVTICTKDKENCFGEVVNNKMQLSEIGKIVKTYWFRIQNHFSFVITDEFIIMPNHIHGIMVICHNNKTNNDIYNNNGRDMINHVSTWKKMTPMGKYTLGEIIRWYKGIVTFHIRNKLCNTFSWQPRFYDHIIRDEKSLLSIREYIHNNPKNWEEDEENTI